MSNVTISWEKLTLFYNCNFFPGFNFRKRKFIDWYNSRLFSLISCFHFVNQYSPNFCENVNQLFPQMLLHLAFALCSFLSPSLLFLRLLEEQCRNMSLRVLKLTQFWVISEIMKRLEYQTRFCIILCVITEQSKHTTERKKMSCVRKL